MTNRVPFIKDPVEVQIPGPYIYKDWLLSGLPIPADEHKLQDYLDTYLNIGKKEDRGCTFVALTPAVYVEVSYYPWARSLWNDEIGFCTSQFEVTLTIFAVRLDLQKRPIDIVATVAYAFVSNSWSLITGRAILGITKLLGNIETSVTPGQVYPTSLESLAQRELGADQPIQSYPILSIDAQAADRPAYEGVCNRLGPVDALYGRHGALPFSQRLTSHFEIPVEELVELCRNVTIAYGVPAVQLKQLRDSESPEKACFQGLVECTFKGSMDSFGLLAPGRVTFKPLASLQICPRLGVKRTSSPIFPYYLTANGKLGDIRNLYITT